MTVDGILSILDRCARNFSFPMLDNGYFYLASARMSVYRSNCDWAIVMELFGFMTRAGIPDLTIQTFSSQLTNRKTVDDYVSPVAYENFLRAHPHDEFDSYWPMQTEGLLREGDDDFEFVAPGVEVVQVGGQLDAIPKLSELESVGIVPVSAPIIEAFELCRFIAETVERDRFFAPPDIRRHHVPLELTQILQLEEWNHPDLCNDQLPSESETFRMLAEVLVTGDTALYRPTLAPNTQWSNWPEGGLL